MDVEKLIERIYKHDKDYGEGRTQDLFRVCLDCKDAAAALSTLQAENEKLRNEVERQRRSADDRKHLYENAERAYMKVVAELEQVKRERDAAIEYLREIEWCAGCKNFGGLDGCKKWVIGQCTEKHDLYEFIGPQKED